MALRSQLLQRSLRFYLLILLNTVILGLSTPKPVIFVFAPHKTGSTLIHQIFTQVTDNLGMCHFRTPFNTFPSCYSKNHCFQGVEQNSADNLRWQAEIGCEKFTSDLIQRSCLKNDADFQSLPLFCRNGFIWAPIRSQATNYTNLLTGISENPFFQTLILYQVRHPLDQLVSEYYSFGFTHPSPVIRPGETEEADKLKLENFYQQRAIIRNMTVGDYVLQKLGDDTWWKVHYGLLFSEDYYNLRNSIHIIRYEQMVIDFNSWLEKFSINLLDPELKARLEKVLLEVSVKFNQSFIPEGGHKRFVLPGSHLKELNSSTLRTAHRKSSLYMNKLGY